MTSFIDALQSENLTTENGMVTNSSTLNATLDLFFTIGAMRKEVLNGDYSRLISKFEASRNEDTLITKKILFWSRDIRQGAGERNIFKVLLNHIATNHPEDLINNVSLIPEYGRWDDLFSLFDTRLESIAIETIQSGLNSEDSLCAKWMPRISGKSSKSNKRIANKIRNSMSLSPKEYRKLLVRLTNVVESNMCSKNFDKINYEHVPSLAMSRYTNAFNRNDSNRFEEYKNLLKDGDVKINTGAIYPYNVLRTSLSGDSELANEQWKALPNYLENSVERVLPVCDTSGSMLTDIGGNTTAIEVCISLGLYISDRNEGPFKNAFVTFSEEPKIQYLTGDLQSRISQISDSDWGFSTNLEATFEHILNQSIKHNVKVDEMPTSILIMSDMEFNQATTVNQTAMQMIKNKYEESGYTIPKIVFWNLASRGNNFPIQSTEDNTSLISGFSPSILKSVLSGNNSNPIELMLEVIDSERYSQIS
tara:strand:- start:855 stop:2288 length:1434 start_codon:yes stop_codon:yes gene_type:complete